LSYTDRNSLPLQFYRDVVIPVILAQAMRIQPKAIDHTYLWVRSLPESKKYYEKVFGIVCRPREGDPKTLVVESEKVHFFISENDGNGDFIPRQHLSFEVESLVKVTKHLRKLGISEYKLGEVSFFSQKNYKWCEWRDPDGIRLECIELK
jgi:catechol 2,3-dioxygenase-like lactoylglutathione lyase family enzyme